MPNHIEFQFPRLLLHYRLSRLSSIFEFSLEIVEFSSLLEIIKFEKIFFEIKLIETKTIKQIKKLNILICNLPYLKQIITSMQLLAIANILIQFFLFVNNFLEKF